MELVLFYSRPTTYPQNERLNQRRQSLINYAKWLKKHKSELPEANVNNELKYVKQELRAVNIALGRS